MVRADLFRDGGHQRRRQRLRQSRPPDSRGASCFRSFVCTGPPGAQSRRQVRDWRRHRTTAAAWHELAGEIAHLVEAGLSPLAAIQAATISGAELLGISARTGSVEPNMEADLIAVDGNPLERIWIGAEPSARHE